MELFKIFVEVKKFRKAIVSCNNDLSPTSFRNFPKGCCSDTTLMLGQFLFEKGYGEFNLVCGTRCGKTHTWLELDDLFIDITADQFVDQQNEIIVLKNSDWHKNFIVDKKHVAKFSNYEEDEINYLKQNLKILELKN